MLKEKFEQLTSLFQEKVGMGFDKFKEISLPEITKIYNQSISLDPKTKPVMDKFIDTAFNEVLQEINTYENTVNFTLFFSNLFCVSINRQMFRYRMENNFEGPLFVRTVVPADVALALKEAFDGK